MRGTCLILSSVLVCASVAVAEAQASRCEVSIVRAPDAVRGVIERWVAAEPDCGGPLEVRVVATDRGLYVVAIDAEQRTFDRVVPDAESAGALVASWAVAATPAPAPGRVALAVAPEVRVLRPIEAEDAATPAAVGPRAGRAFAIGTHAQVGRLFEGINGSWDGWMNLDGELDLVQRGRWSAGVAVHLAGDSSAEMSRLSVSGLAYGAWTTAPSTWRFRAQLGLGLNHTWGWSEYVDFGDGGPTMPMQLRALVSRQVSPRWAIAVGPMLTTLAPFGPRPSFGGVGTAVDLEFALRGSL